MLRLAAIVFLVFASPAALGKSEDPELRCPAETRQVQFSSLVFCWSMARSAAGFEFIEPSADLMQGHQWWLAGRRITENDFNGLPDAQRRLAVLATFTIIPAEHSLIKHHSLALDRSQRITAVIEVLSSDSTRFSVALYQGEKFGEQTFDFRRIGPALYAAEKLLASNDGPTQQIEYWVSMTDAGHVDYIMSCVSVESRQTCSSPFLLSQNLVTVSLSLGAGVASPRAAFEDIRGQLRSYLVSPHQDAP